MISYHPFHVTSIQGKGDDAILRALEEAVEIVGKNTQILLEHYATRLAVQRDLKHGLMYEDTS